MAADEDAAGRRRAQPTAAARRGRRRCSASAGSTSASARSPQRAGVGRGTLFRNFPSKEDLIAAIVVERMTRCNRARHARCSRRRRSRRGAVRVPRARWSAASSSTARCSRRSATRSWPTRRSAPRTPSWSGVLDQLLARAQEAGAVRDGRRRARRADDGQGRVPGGELRSPTSIRTSPTRQLDLVRAALCNRSEAAQLRGRRPTFGDLERAFDAGDAEAKAAGEPSA